MNMYMSMFTFLSNIHFKINNINFKLMLIANANSDYNCICIAINPLHS